MIYMKLFFSKNIFYEKTFFSIYISTVPYFSFFWCMYVYTYIKISLINFICRILHNAVIGAHRRPGRALNHFLKYRINIHSDRYRRTPQVSPLRFYRSVQHVRIYTIMPINRLLSTHRLTQSIHSETRLFCHVSGTSHLNNRQWTTSSLDVSRFRDHKIEKQVRMIYKRYHALFLL